MSNNQKMSIISTIIWIVCAIFFMYEFLLRTVLGTFEHPIIHDLNLNLVTFAILSSTAYQLVYGLMQVPVGIITDRLGLKKTLFFAVVVCAISVFCFGLTHQFDSAVVFRVLMGLGSSFGFICLLVAVYEWMPRKNIALFIGLSQFIGTMGPMAAAGPLNSLAAHSTGAESAWRYVFYSLGIVGIIIGLVVLAVVRNNKDFTSGFQILKRRSDLLGDLKHLLSQRQVWYIALFSASIYFTIEYLSENSGKAFLMLHGFSSNTASYMITLSWLGYAVGCPLLGFISDLLSKRKLVMIFAAIISLISGILIIYLPINVLIISIAFFLLGIGASGQSIGFAIMAERCKNDYLAAGLGFNNALIMLVASVSAPMIGFILSILSHGHALTIANYQGAFTYILVFMGLALLISIFLIKETFCKSMQETTKLSIKPS